MIGVRFELSSGTVYTRYFVKDHLGSVPTITDESGNVVERDAYDAWGKHRYPNGSADPTDSITSLTTRGYIDQEELQDVALIHLNGRVYAPYVARFTSADPMTAQPYDAQGWDRYAYVGNDPLNNTDPSGTQSLPGIAIGAVSGGTAGYIAGGVKGLIIGGIVGAGVGAVAAPLSAAAATAVLTATGSSAAAIVTGTSLFVGENPLAGGLATAATHESEGQPLLSNVGEGAIIGGLVPLASGEAYLIGPGAAVVAGLPAGTAEVLGVQSGIFGTLGALATKSTPK